MKKGTKHVSNAASTGSLASQRHPGKFPKAPGRRLDPWAGKIPESGGSSGEGTGNPLQYSCTHSSNDRTHGIGRIDLAVMEPVASVGTSWRAVLTSKLAGVSLLGRWKSLQKIFHPGHPMTFFGAPFPRHLSP